MHPLTDNIEFDAATRDERTRERAIAGRIRILSGEPQLRPTE